MLLDDYDSSMLGENENLLSDYWMTRQKMPDKMIRDFSWIPVSAGRRLWIFAGKMSGYG